MKKISLLFLLLLFLSTSLTNLAFAGISGDELGDDEEPLMPDQAFVLSSSVIDGNTLRVRWDIVKGYYMYRDKFKFTTDASNIKLGEPSYPPGKIKEDEFFGKVETYRKKAIIDIPFERTGDIKKMTLTTVSQGCADIGVCYPPQTQTVSFNLPPAETLQTLTSSKPESSSFSTLKKIGASLGLMDSTEEFLTPDQAFSFSSEVVDGNNIHVSWDIADGYYLYRDKFKFELRDANGITIGAANFPRGEIKNDEYFGDMEVFHDKVDSNIALLRTNLTATDITLVAKYQGCAEAGFCYPPQTQNMPMALPVGLAAPTAGTSPSSGSEDSDDDLSETDQIASALGKGSTILTMLSFFGFGLLLAFTPCVFPMIPILSSIIVGQGEHITTRRAFTLSLVYVLAMALTYTFAGVMAGLFGENLQAAFQNPWILGTFAGVFVLLSLSMFGFYDLQMPASIQSKFTSVSNSQQGGTLIGVGVMGFLSALIVGPCVAAPLAGALIYIGQTGDAVLGGFALFALSLGMGAPLLAIGTSAGKLLPKAGGWMDTIKAVFGVMLLAVAIWMLERILPVEVIMLMIAALAIICAIFMGALEPVGAGATGWRKFWKGSGIMLFVYGVILVISAAAGGKSYMQPLHGIAMGVSSSSGIPGAATEHIKFKRVRGLEEFERELAAANAENKPVMLDFYADWCISCKEMEKYTFTDPNVQAALSNAVLLQADVTKNDAIDKVLLKHFGIFGPPSIMFFGTDGQERRKQRVIGFMKPEKFSKIATRGLQ